MARRGIDLVVCDIDGTLLTHGLRMPGATLDALRRVREAGVAVATLTGRTLGGTDAASPRLQAICAARGALNGTVTVDASEAPILSATLAPEAVEGALAAIDAAGLSACLLGPRRAHAIIRHPDCARIFRMFDPVVEPFDGVERPYNIIALYGLAEAMRELQPTLARLPALRGPICGSLRSPLSFQFLQPPGVDKGVALEHIAARLGASPDRTIAIGDGVWNDLPLLRAAGVSVAMPAAGQALIDAADHVAPAGPEESGAARFLLEYLDL